MDCHLENCLGNPAPDPRSFPGRSRGGMTPGRCQGLESACRVEFATHAPRLNGTAALTETHAMRPSTPARSGRSFRLGSSIPAGELSGAHALPTVTQDLAAWCENSILGSLIFQECLFVSVVRIGIEGGAGGLPADCRPC
jgi:hypothetical protein